MRRSYGFYFRGGGFFDAIGGIFRGITNTVSNVVGGVVNTVSGVAGGALNALGVSSIGLPFGLGSLNLGGATPTSQTLPTVTGNVIGRLGYYPSGTGSATGTGTGTGTGFGTSGILIVVAILFGLFFLMKK